MREVETPSADAISAFCMVPRATSPRFVILRVAKTAMPSAAVIPMSSSS